MRYLLLIFLISGAVVSAQETTPEPSPEPVFSAGVHDDTDPRWQTDCLASQQRSGAVFGTATNLQDCAFNGVYEGSSIRVYLSSDSLGIVEICIDLICQDATATVSSSYLVTGVSPGQHSISISYVSGSAYFDAVLIDSPAVIEDYQINVELLQSDLVSAWRTTYEIPGDQPRVGAFDMLLSAGDVLTAILLAGLLVLQMMAFALLWRRK